MNTQPMSSAAGSPFFGIPMLFWFAVVVVTLVGLWKVFVKAGQPGWGCIIPIYNAYCLIKIAGKEWWWLLLLFIPFVNIIIGILVLLGVARNFGKGGAFAAGLIFLPFIFYPILGFGDATYRPTPPATAPPVAV